MALNIKIIIITLLFSNIVFGQKTKTLNLENTYWQTLSHQGNANTWTLIPLKKTKDNAKIKYLHFDTINKFHLHLISHFDEKCTKDIFGTYSIDKSQVTFSNLSEKQEKKCGPFFNFSLGKRSIKLRNKKLYLTNPSKWYDSIKRSGDTILFNKKYIHSIVRNKANKNLVNDVNRIPLSDGNYRVYDSLENIIFTIKNGVLEGDFLFKSKKGKIMRMYHSKGELISSKTWNRGTLFLEKHKTIDVKKKRQNYITKLTENKKNYRTNNKDSIITIFRNRQPILKSCYRNNNLISVNNFDKEIFKKFDRKNQLIEYHTATEKIQYDSKGEEKVKEVFAKDSYKLYSYGIIEREKKYEKDMETTILYDEKGKFIKSNKEKRVSVYEIADPYKHASVLTVEQFEGYKNKANKK